MIMTHLCAILCFFLYFVIIIKQPSNRAYPHCCTVTTTFVAFLMILLNPFVKSSAVSTHWLWIFSTPIKKRVFVCFFIKNCIGYSNITNSFIGIVAIFIE